MEAEDTRNSKKMIEVQAYVSSVPEYALHIFP